jgi:hypothetical protein
VSFTEPRWQGVALLGIGWSMALPLLAACARHWQRTPLHPLADRSGEHA